MKKNAGNLRIVLWLLFLSSGAYISLSYTMVKTTAYPQADSVKIGYNTIISNLDVPWEITWGPDNYIWFSEQNGSIGKVNPINGDKKLLLKIGDYYKKKLGLLSMAFHHDIKRFPYLFVNYSYLKDEKPYIKVVRYNWHTDSLFNPKVLLEIPAGTGHLGARLAMAKDGKLMLAIGDFAIPKTVQDVNVLNGKILRMNIDGSIPKDNPQKGSYVWAKGFRVPQGLIFGLNGNLYTSEHGDANDDEVNLIRKGANYGYPNVTGICDTEAEKVFCEQNKVVEPLKAWTPTIAPSSISYYPLSATIPQWKNSLLVTTLKASDLRVLKLNEAGDKVISEKVYLAGQFGRLRDVCVSPAGDVYVSTSNRDWNKTNKFSDKNDDRIIRIAAFVKNSGQTELIAKNQAKPQQKEPTGKVLYTQYCGSCHKDDGNGIADIFPPLKGAEQVAGDKNKLIEIVIKGLSGPIKVKGKEFNQQMPSFSFLKDQELADILTYVRSNFGNEVENITLEEVRSIRNKK